MSRGMTTTATVTDIAALPKSRQSRPQNKILAQLDEQLHHLSVTTLPPYPYLLSVPSDVPYRHSSRFVNTWYEGTPFDRSEEQLQYLSFLPHQGEHESLLKVEGGWADDRGNPIEEEELSPKALPVSGRHTPAELGARKKISLQDYKTKAKTPPDSAPRSQPLKPVEKPARQPAEPKTEVRDSPPPPLEKKKEEQPISSKTNEIKEIPPKVLQMDAPGSSKIEAKSQQSDSPNPAKRRKLSPSSEEPHNVKIGPKVESDSSAVKMPRLLSPTLPSPEKAKEKETRLPQLLSPLLPPSLAKELSTPSSTISIGSPATTPHKRSDPVRSILAGADLDNGQVGDRNGLRPAGSRVRSDSQHSAKSSAPGTPIPAKVALGAKLLGRNVVKGATPLHNGVTRSPGPRQRHTIILKYGKKNRKRVEALLKFAARPKKDLIRHEAADRRSTPELHQRKDVAKESIVSQPSRDVKPKGSAVDDVKPEREKKRKAEDSPGPSMKKVKAVEAEKRPTTPVAPTVKTPLANQPRSTFSTPKKEFKSAAMRRVESTDGADAPTPTGDKVRVSTPQAALKPSPQPPGSTISSRQEDRHQWFSLNEKYFALGRKVKREGTAIQPHLETPKAMLLLIDALLCFMINIGSMSYARPNADPGWRNILAYHVFVWRASRKFPHLHALVVQLGAVCRQLVHKYDMDKLARDPLPEDYCNSAPTPGSDGVTKTNEDGEKYKKGYVEFKDQLISNARELQTAWFDGSRLLSLDLLEREYPKTWSKRSKDSSTRLQEKPTPSRIPNDFYLPLDASSTPFEAVKFGMAFLEEWAEKEKVDWKTRIDL
ncbi:hypothetical protein A1O7_04813 [Cladophialophora yegresii CBS 114405]|uniref:Uncharacterized protein n=1 Tax=Cladophialophora yegresii CBS 114405 TaxID=1182544 RepID=W9W6N8_9EURO|nr:uncharacterized protein A1O7_04813 [Cladophialophora yegresii CBS 114405]EXJ60660.1 hypothetical protein A1O7_04813 [Cladophialophora yegresii CBS 114405]